MTSFKMRKMIGAKRSSLHDHFHRKVVCRRCGHIMNDAESGNLHGEFIHAKRVCSNSGKYFSLAPEHMKEVAPFESKRIRRAAKRAGTSV